MKKPQLFLLHFAGGSCYSFQFLVPELQGFEVVALELPGRGKRTKEALLTDFDAAAQDIFEQLKAKINSPHFVIYGHSMGAYLALHVARMLENVNVFPTHVFVSGNAGPGVSGATKRYLLGQKDFVEELRKMGGVPMELFDNKDLLEYFLPIVRADFQIAEQNKLSNDCVVKAPIYAMMGSQEEQVAAIANWGRFTQGVFQYSVLTGGHFFIYDHPTAIATIINDRYQHSVFKRAVESVSISATV
ncbi:thioesterase II family protein [Hymenobacter lucidus]|uniref:Alpha/beta fold hydrolase n=1 Tax=Hymenobacter lucidus TaxID=2880930 RepID=A0ABS8AY08_9BACT|nr:alpha/beta fold hydrolase [Hymenobacter lucidus]MCB2410663.1 alpha/beta fold hydrolase [Hymenobacter lucidus]